MSADNQPVAMAIDAFGRSESCCLLAHADYETWKALCEKQGLIICTTTVDEMMARIDEEGDSPIH